VSVPLYQAKAEFFRMGEYTTTPETIRAARDHLEWFRLVRAEV
jgi:hypothetical protein